MKKKIICIMLIIISIIMTIGLAEEKQVIIAIDYEELKMTDANPFIDSNNRTQVPLRVIAEALDADLKWEEENQKITIKKGSKSIILTIGENVVSVNGDEIVQDTAPMIIDGRTYVPVRFISEALGERVFWKAGGINIVYIDTARDGEQFLQNEVIEAAGFKIKIEKDDEAKMTYEPYRDNEDLDYYMGDVIEGTFMGEVYIRKESELVISEELPYVNKLNITVGGHGLYRDLESQLRDLEEILLSNISKSTVERIIDLFRNDIIQWQELPTPLMKWQGGKRIYNDGDYIIEINQDTANENGYTNYIRVSLTDKNGYKNALEAQEDMLKYKQKTNNIFEGVVDYSKEVTGSMGDFEYANMYMGEREIKGLKILVEEGDIAQITSSNIFIDKLSGVTVNVRLLDNDAFQTTPDFMFMIKSGVVDKEKALNDMKKILNMNFSKEITTSIIQFFNTYREAELETEEFNERGHRLSVLSTNDHWDLRIYLNQ